MEIQKYFEEFFRSSEPLYEQNDEPIINRSSSRFSEFSQINQMKLKFTKKFFVQNPIPPEPLNSVTTVMIKQHEFGVFSPKIWTSSRRNQVKQMQP